MDKKYACYCGLYCENCAVKAKVESASKILHDEMNKLGFEEIMPFFLDGEKLWDSWGEIQDERKGKGMGLSYIKDRKE